MSPTLPGTSSSFGKEADAQMSLKPQRCLPLFRGDGAWYRRSRADNALNHAKAAGKNVHLRFDADMEASVTRRFALLNELRKAADSGQLTLLY